MKENTEKKEEDTPFVNSRKNYAIIYLLLLGGN